LWAVTCREQSQFQYLAVEYMKNSKTVLYVGDGGTRSIIVWDVESNEIKRVKLPHIIVQGCVNNPKKDIFYMALVEQQTDNYIYFTYLCSPDMYRTKIKDLRKHMHPGCIVNIGNITIWYFQLRLVDFEVRTAIEHFKSQIILYSYNIIYMLLYNIQAKIDLLDISYGNHLLGITYA